MFSKKNNTRRGFTLVELLVTISILVVITAIILVNQNRFGGTISLSNLAYQLALTIRQAQTYGVSVLETGAGTGNFQAAYGVHFTSGTPTSYILFRDFDGSGRYSGPTENMVFLSIQNGNRIYSICGTLAGGTVKCNPTITSLDILFTRPDPDAIIRTDIIADTYQSAQITLQSGQGLLRTVTVSVTGQIAVEQGAH
jgi:prepilin-type N-terminal cleavage/methylation domain-containing protein